MTENGEMVVARRRLGILEGVEPDVSVVRREAGGEEGLGGAEHGGRAHMTGMVRLGEVQLGYKRRSVISNKANTAWGKPAW